jgi:2-furoate---CoA ligase
MTGIMVTPLNWRVKVEELDYCLTDAEARAVVFEEVSATAVAGSNVAKQLPRIGV